MLDLLSDYLDVATSPEEKLVIERALNVLDKMGLEDYEYVFEDMIGTVDEVDADKTMDEVRTYVTSLMFTVLKQHSIEIEAEASMAMLADLIQALLDLDNHEERESLMAIVNQDNISTNEMFAELVAMVTKYTTDDILQIVSTVSSTFLDRIRTNQNVVEHEEVELPTDRQKLIADLKAYLTFVAHLGGAPHLESVIRSGMDVGMPFHLYAQAMLYIFDKLKPEAIGRELFGIAVICGNGYSTRNELIKVSLESFVSEPDIVTAIMAQVNQLAIGFKQ